MFKNSDSLLYSLLDYFYDQLPYCCSLRHRRMPWNIRWAVVLSVVTSALFIGMIVCTSCQSIGNMWLVLSSSSVVKEEWTMSCIGGIDQSKVRVISERLFQSVILLGDLFYLAALADRFMMVLIKFPQQTWPTRGMSSNLNRIWTPYVWIHLQGYSFPVIRRGDWVSQSSR